MRLPQIIGGVLVAVLITVSASTALTACNPVRKSWTWKGGNTHGAIIETTAGRASLAVYRQPTKALNHVLNGLGIRKVQDYLWAFGKPPEIRKTFSFQGKSVTLSFGTATKALRTLSYKLIYDDPADLKGALVDANKNNACLALTLISYGKPTSNWTYKKTGCLNGGF